MQIDFRPLERRHFGLLSEWLAAPHVERWWREEHDPATVERRYGPPVDRREPTEIFVVEADGEPIGLIQRYRLRDHPEWQRAMTAAGPPVDAACIDYLIGVEAMVGRGLGGPIIDRFSRDTFARWTDVSSIAVAVQQENRRSWRALEKAGYRRTWSGTLDSDDPSDEGPSHVYVRDRSGESDLQ